MPPYLPIIGLNRSQAVRVGRGPGNAVPNEFNMGDITTNPGSGGLFSLFYADLGKAEVRRDLQRHDAVGGIETMGNASNVTYGDLYIPTGVGLTPSGSNLTIAVAAGQLASRFYNSRITVPAQTVTLATPSVGGLLNWVYVTSSGTVGVFAGSTDTVAPTYEVWTFSTTSTPTGNVFLQFTWNGITYTTAGFSVAATTTAATIAGAIQAATGGPSATAAAAGSTFASATGMVPTSTVTGSGGALPTPVVITFSGAVEGPVIPTMFDTGALTGGTATLTRTAVGSGASTPLPTGSVCILGGYYTTSATANAAAATRVGGSTVAPMTA